MGTCRYCRYNVDYRQIRLGHLNTFILKFRKNLLPVDMSLWSNTKTSNESWSVLGTTCTVYRQLSSSILPRMSRTVLDSANSSSMLLSPDDNIQFWCFAHRKISAENPRCSPSTMSVLWTERMFGLHLRWKFWSSRAKTLQTNATLNTVK